MLSEEDDSADGVEGVSEGAKWSPVVGVEYLPRLDSSNCPLDHVPVGIHEAIVFFRVHWQIFFSLASFLSV
ncbi:hypothetical protein [Rathayibacter rathayi]|uniref:hypothetical protein n=1 Tax=Rathayibacter rathayi TaxID=33887 RepID=UPI0011AFF8F0|nr:hypothetical protein [Rathayibacter rathayi]